MNRKVVVTAVLALAALLVLVILIGQTERGRRGLKTPSEANALYNTALSLQSEDNLVKAAQLYRDLIRQYPNFKQISEVEKRLWDLNIKILFSPVVADTDITYKVGPGDTLGGIAGRHNTTVALIKRSNRLKSNLIRPGKRLKVSTAIYSVIIDKSQNSLALKADDEVFKVYPVATGKHNSTPIGSFTIVEKLKDPAWYKGGGEGIIPAGSPKNVLGTRWLGLSEPEYGIHGGGTKEILGTQVTDGCVRMTDPDVEELFAILPRGTEVTIVD